MLDDVAERACSMEDPVSPSWSPSDHIKEDEFRDGCLIEGFTSDRIPTHP